MQLNIHVQDAINARDSYLDSYDCDVSLHFDLCRYTLFAVISTIVARSVVALIQLACSILA